MIRLRLLAMLLAASLLGSCGRTTAASRFEIRVEGDEVTFLVAADTHLGADGMVAANERQIAAMNDIAGKPWPGALGGTVEEPAVVIVAGDLTDRGRLDEWYDFVRLYGAGERRGVLAHPVWIGTGNHDRPVPLLSPVPSAAFSRQGHLRSVMYLAGLHVIALDVYPDAAGLRWLKPQLERIGKEEPILLWFHYPLAGPYSDWWTDEEKKAFRSALEGYRIVAVFHGHYHRSGHYEWKGLPIYNVGSPRHSDHSFACVRWREGRLDVATWDWRRGRWAWHRGEPRAHGARLR